MDARSLRALADDDVLRRLADLVGQSRRTEAEIVAHIAEVDARKLYLRHASASMFTYCTEVLHLSEAEAYLRILAGRASREYPLLLEMLADGRLHLSGVGKLAPHLTSENAGVLLARAAHKTKQQILELIAEAVPRRDAQTMVRRLPRPLPPALDVRSPREAAGGEIPACAQLRPDAVETLGRTTQRVEPLSPDRYKIQFTASRVFKDKIERLRALVSPAEGDLVALLESALDEKLARLEARRFARTKAPRQRLDEAHVFPRTRHIPAAVRREVHRRDEGRCRFVDGQGRRCSERRWLELHHRYPFGRGGDHSPDNVALLCGAHHALVTEGDWGTGSG